MGDRTKALAGRAVAGTIVGAVRAIAEIAWLLGRVRRVMRDG